MHNTNHEIIAQRYQSFMMAAYGAPHPTIKNGIDASFMRDLFSAEENPQFLKKNELNKYRERVKMFLIKALMRLENKHQNDLAMLHKLHAEIERIKIAQTADDLAIALDSIISLVQAS